MNTNEAKRAVANRILKTGVLYVQFRTDDKLVRVPDALQRANKTLCLTFGHDLKVPIPDMYLTELGISGTLQFPSPSPKTYWCFVPWKAVYSLADDKWNGGMWEEDLPEEIRRAKEAHARRADLKLVRGGALLSKPAIGVLKLVTE